MKTTIYEQIKIMMRRNGSSVEKIADRLGCTRQNLNTKLKRGNMRIDEIEQIANLLDCDLIIELRERGGSNEE